MLPGEHRADCQPLVAPDQIDWQTADMTATFGADVPWHNLDQNNGLWLPVDCEGNPAATISALVSRNSTGPLRLGYGAWRDLLLGCQFLNGKGDLITAGGRTVKNVAGYDLTKFMVGQNGVFGKIVTVTTRVYRKPDDAAMAEFEPRLEMFNQLLISPCKPQWAILTSDALTCGYLGNERTIQYYLEQLPSWQPRRLERNGFGADVAWRTAHWRRIDGESGLPMRASVSSAKIQEFAQRAKLKNWIADPTFGIVLANADETAIESAASVGGRAWLYQNDGDGRIAAFSPSPAERTILEKLKQSFDPDGHLVPLPAIGISPSPGTPGEGRGEGLLTCQIAAPNQNQPSPYPSPGVPGEGTRGDLAKRDHQFPTHAGGKP